MNKIHNMQEENNIDKLKTEYEEVDLNEEKDGKYEIDYPRLFVMILILTIVGVIFYMLLYKKNQERVAEEKRVQEELVQKELNNPFKNISITGKAAFVLDVKTGEKLYGLNEEEQLPLASLTKLMTALTASDLLSNSRVITISNKDLQKEGDSGLKLQEKWNFKDLLDFTLMVSSNDGASAIASAAGAVGSTEDSESFFVDEMNEKAREIGLNQTFFLNETGLDPNEEVSGSYGSVRDVAILMRNILETDPDILSATVYDSLNIKSIDQFIHKATNTNQSIGNIPGLIASKTGFTDLAGGNLVVAFDAGINRPIIVVVLGSTKEGRFEDVEKLVSASLAFLTQ